MRVVGAISGTSVDAIDVAVCELAPDPEVPVGGLTLKLLGYQEQPFPPALRERILRLFREQVAPLADLTELNFVLGDAFAAAILHTVASSGLALADMDLIASHGQTIYHLVEPGRRPSTLQMGEAAVITRQTGVTTVSDFRVADVAAGGEGAPLASFLDALLFSSDARTSALQNIGGIGNVTFLPAGSGVDGAYAFDTGPGNALIDYGARHFSGGRAQLDRDGAMARAGRVSRSLLEEALRHPYFGRRPPKTTGREVFGDGYAAALIARAAVLGLSPQDTMATLTAITGESIAVAYRDFGPERIDQVVVSGGGGRNTVLLDHLRSALPGAQVMLYDGAGLASDAKEAALFALLGYEGVHGRTANLPRCTGALAPAVLGKVTPGANYRSLIQRVAAQVASSESEVNALETRDETTPPATRTLRLVRR